MTAPTITRVPCPVAGCTYKAENVGSIPAHIAMAHGGSVAQAAPDPDELTCVGSNHVPGCEHLRASASKALVRTAGDARLLEIPLELVDVADNVRVTLVDIDELAASIVELGVLQPVKATLLPDGRYRLLWGQRRVLAARQAGLATIPALVSTEEPDDRPIEQLVENLHRADLNPIDRAQAMRAVVDAGVSQADLARKLGIAPSTVANDLRILTLDDLVVEQVRSGAISASHGKAMVGLLPKDQRELAGRIAAEKLPAHRIEYEISWRRQAAEAEEAKEKRTAKAAPKLVAALEASKVAKTTPVQIRGALNLDQRALERAVKAAGWKLLESGYAYDRPAKGKCDCDVVRMVEFNRTWKVESGCVDNRHGDRQRNVDQGAEQARAKAIDEKVADLTARLLPRLADVDLAVLLLSCARSHQELPALIEGAGDEDRAQLRQQAAERLAYTASSRHAWGDQRAAADKALDDILAMLPEATA